MASAQSKKVASDSLVARISYTGGRYWQGHDSYCFALYRSGYFQILTTVKGSPPVPGEPRSLPVPSKPESSTHPNQATQHGTLSQSQLRDVGNMLENLDFKGERGGIVLGGSERFVAEVIRGAETIRYVWLNPDHRKPFPSSAARVIDWLQDFDDKDASPLTLHDASDHSICPSLSDNAVQPLTAGLAR
jgi:hypothetical protein